MKNKNWITPWTDQVIYLLKFSRRNQLLKSVLTLPDQKLLSVLTHFVQLNFETQRGVIHAYEAIQMILNKKNLVSDK